MEGINLATFKIAHIKEQGINIIIIPMATSFGDRSESDRFEIIELLQAAAVSAQLRGKVVPMWQEERGYKFIAPPEWQPYFRTVKWKDLKKNLNRELTCDDADRRGVNPNFTLSTESGRWTPAGVATLLRTCWNHLVRVAARTFGDVPKGK